MLQSYFEKNNYRCVFWEDVEMSDLISTIKRGEFALIVISADIGSIVDTLLGSYNDASWRGKVIMLSYAQEKEYRDYMESGDIWLQKPFTLTQLSDCLQEESLRE